MVRDQEEQAQQLYVQNKQKEQRRAQIDAEKAANRAQVQAKKDAEKKKK